MTQEIQKDDSKPVGIAIIDGSIQLGGVTHYINGWVREDGHPSGDYTAYGHLLASPHNPPVKGLDLKAYKFPIIFTTGWPKGYPNVHFVLTQFGDYGYAKMKLDFGDKIGHLTDSWKVVNDNPVTLLHTKGGSIPKIDCDVTFPIKRDDVKFEWAKEKTEDGLYKSFGSCIFTAAKKDGTGVITVKATYEVEHTAIKPDISLPSTMTGHREIVEYDEISGEWKGKAYKETK